MYNKLNTKRMGGRTSRRFSLFFGVVVSDGIATLNYYYSRTVKIKLLVHEYRFVTRPFYYILHFVSFRFIRSIMFNAGVVALVPDTATHTSSTRIPTDTSVRKIESIRVCIVLSLDRIETIPV